MFNKILKLFLIINSIFYFIAHSRKCINVSSSRNNDNRTVEYLINKQCWLYFNYESRSLKVITFMKLFTKIVNLFNSQCLSSLFM